MATKYTGTDNITNPSDSISTNTLKVYDRNLLERAVEEFVISKFTAKKTQPKYNGKTAVFSVYDQIPATAFTAATLGDGVTPTATDLTKKSVTADIADYGAFVELTDEVSVYHEDGAGLVVEASDNLGAGAGTAIESLLFAETEANAGIDFVTTPEATTELGLDKAETQLRVNLGKKFKSMITGSKNTDTKTIRE
jgi:N4-gp56 family major capsid protein